MRCLSEVRQRRIYAAIREAHTEKGYPIELACELFHAVRSAYYKWASGKLSRRTAENERLAEKLEQLHAESPDKGYRRLNDDLRHDCGIHVNDKRVFRICRVKDIRSTVKYNNRGCTRHAKNPQYLAENLLDRQFYAAKPNEKWLTDVTEFKWYEGTEVHKLMQAGMTQSMSRVAHCIDNGPMEGFWGILKRERYYGRRFTSKRELIQMIQQYICYYNTRRVQRNLGVLTPMEKHALCLAA